MSDQEFNLHETLHTKEFVKFLKEYYGKSGYRHLKQIAGTEVVTREFFEIVIDTIREVILSGHKMRLNGFGIFQTKYRPEREFTNPLSGKQSIAPSHVGVLFTVSQRAKQVLNSEKRLLAALRTQYENKR
ncbi:HU family DNA-binding protein [Psittacicella hinzii]|uniref:Integration host factor subunit alpha n=1 Tax=Psittacicella hinzii TaxID=2028575 RepID=A0A3A1YLK1_9GAMM|nr:HU family DNA-binding protein [Psittacicella hinzii]RIY39032.1 hypothetical protein CKF58_02910 [Psittacicella hinzii]